MNKPLLVLNYPIRLTYQQREEVRGMLAPVVENLGAEAIVLEPGVTAEVHHDMTPLVAAIKAQTAAIDRLVDVLTPASAT